MEADDLFRARSGRRRIKTWVAALRVSALGSTAPRVRASAASRRLGLGLRRWPTKQTSPLSPKRCPLFYSATPPCFFIGGVVSPPFPPQETLRFSTTDSLLIQVIYSVREEEDVVSRLLL